MGGLQILQAYFNMSCLSRGCWVIDTVYSKTSPSAKIALYLPRVQKTSAGVYAEAFNQSYFLNKFPCSIANLSSKAATTCCLQDFVGQYHVISSFAVTSAECDPASPNALTQSDSVVGYFSDMVISMVVELPPTNGQSTMVSRARLLLDGDELRSVASTLSGAIGVEEKLDLFVGLAQFVPTSSRILDSSASQVRLSLTKSKHLTVSTFGSNAYTFLSYISVHVHEVLDATDPTKRSQYAAVSFVLNDQYSPNLNTELIPLASVLVGYGKSEGQATWTQACTQVVSAEFAVRLAQTCGPAVKMCTAIPAMDLADRFVTVNVPLQTAAGGPLFDLDDAALLQSVFVSLVVSVVDSGGRPVSTKLSTAVSVAQGGVGTWCDEAAGLTTLEDVVDTVDLLVGTVGSAQDLARLQRVTGIHRAGMAGAHNVTQSVGSRSIESGLLTLAIKGADAYFGLPGTAAYALELEDVATLHIMGDSKYAAVAALLVDPAAAAFLVVADRINRRASLAVSPALAGLCGPVASAYPQGSCVLRYDVRARAPSPNMAYEITAAPNAAAAAFMQGVAGRSAYAAGLGANFSALIAAQYALAGRAQYRRAWWINPGFTWTGAGVAGADRFTLSQWVVTVALVALNENVSDSIVPAAEAVQRRRGLLTATAMAGARGGGSAGATVQYGVDAAFVMGLNLGLPLNHTTTWRLLLRLTTAQACLSPAALADALREKVRGYVGAAANGMVEVGLVSVDVALGSVVCRRAAASPPAAPSRRAAAGGGAGEEGAAATIYFILAIAAEATGGLDVARLRQMPGVLSITLVSSASGASDGASLEAESAVATVAGGPQTTLIVGMAAAAAVLAAGAVVGVLAWQSREERMGLQRVDALGAGCEIAGAGATFAAAPMDCRLVFDGV